MCYWYSTSPSPLREGSGLWGGLSFFQPGWLCGSSLDNARGVFVFIIVDGWAVFDVMTVPIVCSTGVLGLRGFGFGVEVSHWLTSRQPRPMQLNCPLVHSGMLQGTINSSHSSVAAMLSFLSSRPIALSYRNKLPYATWQILQCPKDNVYHFTNTLYGGMCYCYSTEVSVYIKDISTRYNQGSLEWKSQNWKWCYCVITSWYD